MVDNYQKMLKERLRHVLSIKRLSVQKFVQLIATLDDEKRDLNLVSMRVMLCRQINGDALVTYETIRMFLLAFHDVDANYLVMGYGAMEKSENNATLIYTTTNSNTVAENAKQTGPVNIGRDNRQVVHDQYIEQLQQENVALKAENTSLKRDKEFLQGMLSSLTNNSGKK